MVSLDWLDRDFFFDHFFQGSVPDFEFAPKMRTRRASRGIQGPLVPRTLSIRPYGGRTALFRPDLMFSGPGFSCSGNPKQAWKLPESPSTLEIQF